MWGALVVLMCLLIFDDPSTTDGWQCYRGSQGVGEEGHPAWEHMQSVKCIEKRPHWPLLAVSWNRAGMNKFDLCYSLGDFWGFYIVGREVQSELNVENVVYLKTSVRVGRLAVIHMRMALFAFPSISPPRPQPFHSLSVHIIVSLFCSLIPFHCLLPHLSCCPLSFPNTHTQVCMCTYTLAPFLHDGGS